MRARFLFPVMPAPTVWVCLTAVCKIQNTGSLLRDIQCGITDLRPRVGHFKRKGEGSHLMIGKVKPESVRVTI